MLIRFLFDGDKFLAIVGEEENASISILPPAEVYKIDDLIIPKEFHGVVDSTVQSIKDLAVVVHPTAFKQCTVFIDPVECSTLLTIFF